MIKACLLVFGVLLPLLADAGLRVETDSLRLQFSDTGNLLYAEACFPACADAGMKSRVLSGDGGMLSLVRTHAGPLQNERQHLDSTTVLSFTDPQGDPVHRWRIPDRGWLISLETSAGAAALTSGVNFRPTPSSGFGYLLEQTRYLVFDEDDATTTGLGESGSFSGASNGWFGFRNRFWTAMVLSRKSLPLNLATGEQVLDARVDMGQGEKQDGLDLDVYLGPVEPSALSETAAELESLMYSSLWFFLRWICQGMYHLLNLIAMAVPQWGLAVILLSLAVGLLMRPLSRIADRLQDQVHATEARLAPELAEIKENHKGAEQSEKIIALYKKSGVHPLYSLKGLAGVMLVIPVFIGAFNMLAENIHLSGESFLWIADLSQPDMLWQMPFRLPFFGEHLNLLPFIMTGFSVVASKLHSHPAMDAAQSRKQTRNLLAMTGGFLVLFYTFPAGMVLYWTTNNLVSVIKTLWKNEIRTQSKVPE